MKKSNVIGLRDILYVLALFVLLLPTPLSAKNYFKNQRTLIEYATLKDALKAAAVSGDVIEQIADYHNTEIYRDHEEGNYLSKSVTIDGMGFNFYEDRTCNYDFMFEFTGQSAFTFRNCHFRQETSANPPALSGLFCSYDNATHLVLDNCTIEGMNFTQATNAVIKVPLITLSNTTIQNNVVYNSEAGTVHALNTVYVSGLTIVSGNTKEGSDVERNIIVGDANHIYVSGLLAGSNIGVYHSATVCDSYRDVEFATNAQLSDAIFFHNDRETNTVVIYDDGTHLFGKSGAERIKCEHSPKEANTLWFATNEGFAVARLSNNNGTSWTNYMTLQAAINDVNPSPTSYVEIYDDLTLTSKLDLGSNTYTLRSNSDHDDIFTLYPDFYDLMFDFGDGINLTLSNIILDGEEGYCRGIGQLMSGTLNLQSGCTIQNFTLGDVDLTTQYVGELLLSDINGDVEVNMYDGAVVKDCEGGAGFFRLWKNNNNHHVTFNMYGGLIDHMNSWWYDGSAVLINGGTMNMSGGTIRNGYNHATAAVWLHDDDSEGTVSNFRSVFNMTGGTITGNETFGVAAAVKPGYTEINVGGTAVVDGNTLGNIRIHEDDLLTLANNFTGSIGVFYVDNTSGNHNITPSNKNANGYQFGVNTGAYTGVANFFCDVNPNLNAVLNGTKMMWDGRYVVDVTNLSEVEADCYTATVDLAVKLYPSDASPEAGTEYQWQKDGTDITGATSSTYQATESGTYTCVISVGGIEQSTSNSVDVFVDSPLTFDNHAGDHDWFNQGNWAPNYNRIPSSSTDITIRTGCVAYVANASTNGVGVANDVDMEANSGIAVKPTGRLALGGDITYGSGSEISIENNATNQGALSITEGNTLQASTNVNGVATLGGYMTEEGKTINDVIWQYIALPLESGNSVDYDFYGTYMTEWNENSTGNGANWRYLVNGNNAQLFRGYGLTQRSAQHYWFSGTLPTSDHSFSDLSYTATIGSQNNTYKGMHLLGNSYSAPIDVSAMLESDFTNLEKTFYVYHHGSNNDAYTDPNAENTGTSPGQYEAISLELAKAGECGKYIPSMQAFFVVATAADAGLNLDYDRVVHQPNKSAGNHTASAAFAPGRLMVAEESPIWGKMVITAQSDGLSDRTVLYLNDDCSDSYDNGWDGKKMMGSVNVPQVYFYGLENGQWLVYQYDVTNHVDSQYFEVRAGRGDTITLTLDVSEMRLLMDELYMLDYTTNQVVDLLTMGDTVTYTYLSSGQCSERLFQIFSHRSPSVITVMDEVRAPARECVYDIMGRRVADRPTVPGVYIYMDNQGIHKEIVR